MDGKKAKTISEVKKEASEDKDKAEKEAYALPTHFEDDGLLTRKAFKPAFTLLGKALEAQGYRPDCKVDISFTITPVEPRQQSLGNIKVPTHRVLVPLVLEVNSDGKVEFFNNELLVDSSGKKLGALAYLQENPEPKRLGRKRAPVALEQLALGILASSAFPVAFSPVPLEVCFLEGDSWKEPCNRESSSREYFTDGGVFDNAPLTPLVWPSKKLEESKGKDNKKRIVPSLTIFFDPDYRVPRSGGTQSPTNKSSPSIDLATTLSRMLGWVSSGRNYEIAALARYYGPSDSSKGTVIGQVAEAIESFQGPKRQGPTRGSADGHQKYLDSVNAHLKNTIKTEFKLEVEELSLPKALRSLEERVRRSLGGSGLTEKEADALVYIVGMAISAYELDEPQSLKRQLLALEEGVKRGWWSGAQFVARRFPPLTGGQLGNFGAFFSKAFREYDFLAGLFDATVNFARFRLAGGKAEPESLLQDTLDSLSLDRPQREVLGKLAENYLKYSDLSCPKLQKGESKLCLFLQGMATWQEGDAASFPPMKVLKVLEEVGAFNAKPKIDVFLRKLAQSNFCSDGTTERCSKHLVQSLKGVAANQWWGFSGQKVLYRLREIERRKKLSKGIPNRLASLVDFSLRKAGDFGLHRGIDWSPTSVPNNRGRTNTLWYLLPYRVGLNGAGLSLYAGWEAHSKPYWQRLQLRGSVDLNIRSSRGEYLSGLSLGLGAAFQLKKLVLHSLALGVTAEASMGSLAEGQGGGDFWGLRWGGYLYADLLAELLRFEVRGYPNERYFRSAWRFRDNRQVVPDSYQNVFGQFDFILWLTDLPGIVFWFINVGDDSAT